VISNLLILSIFDSDVINSLLDPFSLKITDIVIPAIIEIIIENKILAIPILYPSTCIVKKIDATLIAGPAYRKVIAGPRPEPLSLIPANIGKIVHEQTARTIPDIDVMLYEIIFLVLFPRYFKMVPLFIKTFNAPAMKNAGIRHVKTCFLAYSFKK